MGLSTKLFRSHFHALTQSFYCAARYTLTKSRQFLEHHSFPCSSMRTTIPATGQQAEDHVTRLQTTSVMLYSISVSAYKASGTYLFNVSAAIQSYILCIKNLSVLKRIFEITCMAIIHHIIPNTCPCEKISSILEAIVVSEQCSHVSFATRDSLAAYIQPQWALCC